MLHCAGSSVAARVHRSREHQTCLAQWLKAISFRNQKRALAKRCHCVRLAFQPIRLASFLAGPPILIRRSMNGGLLRGLMRFENRPIGDRSQKRLAYPRSKTANSFVTPVPSMKQPLAVLLDRSRSSRPPNRRPRTRRGATERAAGPYPHSLLCYRLLVGRERRIAPSSFLPNRDHLRGCQAGPVPSTTVLGRLVNLAPLSRLGFR